MTECDSALNLPELKISSLFSDHMVLQRDKRLEISGQARPGSSVVLKFRHHTRKGTADSSGQWSISLPALSPGGPDSLTLTDGTGTLIVTDILVGDVWVCSGQSNMERTVANSFDAAQTIAAADYPSIRQYRVPHKDSPTPLIDPDASWVVCSPATAGDFTAVGYHFAQEVQRVIGIPIGLLNASWGGSEIEPFVPAFVFEEDATFRVWLERQQNTVELRRRPLASCFHGMIHPLTRVSVRGVLWYQGESNVHNAAQYAALFPAMIEAWRRAWGDGELPFYFVQLPNYSPAGDELIKITLPEMREAQAQALKLKQTGMTVAIDLGDPDDIHPYDKRELGRRIALQVLSKTYGLKQVWSGPIYLGHQRRGTGIVVKFGEVGCGLCSADGKPIRAFSVAGSDGVFHPCNATIEEADTLFLSTPKVPHPTDVCHAWTGDPQCNLVNSAHLPASPFRTDRWTWATEGCLWPF